MPTIARKLFAVRLVDADRHADAVGGVDVDGHDRAVDAVREAVRRRDRLRRGDGLRFVVVDEVVVRGGEGGEVRGRLLVAALGERGPAVQREPGHADEDDQGQGEDDEDLAVRAHDVFASLDLRTTDRGEDDGAEGRQERQDRVEGGLDADPDPVAGLAGAGDRIAGEVDAGVGRDRQALDQARAGIATIATVSGLVPMRRCPGWTLVSRAISRAASETPLNVKTPRARSTIPTKTVRKMMIAKRELDQALAARLAPPPHGVTVTVRVRVSFPPKFETTRVIV